MSISFEDQIRERAYHIWQAGGMADGFAIEHWVRAEEAMRGEIDGHPAEPEVILTKAPARKAAAARTTSKTAVKTVTADKTATKAKTASKAAKPAVKAAARAPRASKAKKVELSASI